LEIDYTKARNLSRFFSSEKDDIAKVLTEQKTVKRMIYKLFPFHLHTREEILESYKEFFKLSRQKGTGIYKVVDQLLENLDVFSEQDKTEG
jgi:hypothetical protein